MATRSFDAKLAAVRAGDAKAVKDALASTSGVLIAAAVPFADVAALPPAFVRLCEDGAKRDPGCRGKLAIVHALHEAERWESDVFVRGLSHTQLEGWGPAEDTAGALRAICGLAHARFMQPNAVDVLADLLADPERNARLGAAQALAETRATGLLRFKILTNDREAEVLAACVESLLAIDRDEQMAFVVALLREHDTRAEVAAIALGAARNAAAAAPLIAWCAGCTPAQRHRVGYVALALLRSDEGNTYLLDAVRGNGKADAIGAARALATFKEEMAERLRAAAAQHRDPAVRREVEELLR
jgi:hypothetical protein